MAVKDLMSTVSEIISDARTKGFEYSDTNDVPNVATSGLTYESGETKKGKKIKTCVLYVDIRNSVKLIEGHQFDTMGKVYTAFTKSVLKIAEHHNGKTRNIIGDRVMIVFPSQNCFTNAVDCAISINHAAGLINSTFNHVDFKCGIGIDYGEMRVLKVGIEKKGGENQDNKNLVWVGYPANRASRLTDFANKSISESYYQLTKYPLNPYAFSPLMQLLLPPQERGKPQPDYLQYPTTEELSPEEFAEIVQCSSNGSFYITTGKYIRHEKKTRETKYPSILMTEDVYNGFKSENPNRSKSITENLWQEVGKEHIRNIDQKVFGGDIVWIF